MIDKKMDGKETILTIHIYIDRSDIIPHFRVSMGGDGGWNLFGGETTHRFETFHVAI